MDYQIRIGDMPFIEKLENEPGRTAFIDECGGFGFKFEAKGVQPYYVVCAVVVNNERISEIENQIENLKRCYFGNGEMKSMSIADNHRRRAAVLTELIQLDYNIVVLIADKRKFKAGSPLSEYRPTFKKYLNSKLYEALYSVFPKLKIVEDEYGTNEFQQEFKQYIKTRQPQINLFNEYDFDYVDSKKSNIVQIADVMAGSVMQHLLDSEAPNVLKIFQGKLANVVYFPDTTSFFTPKADSTEFDGIIYELACKRAIDYIQEHKNYKDETIKLQVLFLEYLLYVVNILNESRYIYADEIVDYLSRMTHKKIKKDRLYRSIVARLRDNEVIIASSSRGYKIPTKVADVSDYVNQTTTVTGPMISRIGKCRTLIKAATDGRLDILDDKALIKYRRYFGDFN